MARLVKPAGAGSSQSRRLTMHGTKAERRLMGGLGRLVRKDGSRVEVSGDKPGQRQRPRP